MSFPRVAAIRSIKLINRKTLHLYEDDKLVLSATFHSPEALLRHARSWLDFSADPFLGGRGDRKAA